MLQITLQSITPSGSGATNAQIALGGGKFGTDMGSAGNYLQRLAVYASGDIPAASDVRKDVAVDSTVGSLVVPAASNVKTGVTFDNGTVGTLATGGGKGGIKIGGQL